MWYTISSCAGVGFSKYIASYVTHCSNCVEAFAVDILGVTPPCWNGCDAV